MEKTLVNQDDLFKLFYERKTLSWVQLGEMFSFTGTNETSREVLGAIGNLVVDGFVEKLPGITPPIWKITKSGIANFTGRPLSEEENELYNLQVHDVGSDLRARGNEDARLAALTQTMHEVQHELEKASARLTQSYLLSWLSISLAILSLVALIFLSKCHT